MVSKKNILIGIIVLLLISVVSNVILKGDYASIAGENQYSHSYFGHLSWIVQDWTENPELLLQSHKCANCQHFGMYSRWVMFWLYILLLPADLLQINPHIWYFIITFGLQFIGFKYFFRSINKQKDLSNFEYIILTLFFTTIPYKYIQFTSIWEYPFVYAVYFILLGSGWRMIKNGLLKRNELIFTMIAAFFTLNVGINHLPLTIYTIAIIFLIALLRNRDKYKEIMFQFIIIFLPTILLNLPIILSIFLNKDIKTYEGFIRLKWSSILSFGYFGEYYSNNFAVLFAVSVVGILLAAYLTIQKREYIKIVMYLLASVLIGILGSRFVYQYVFQLPLFNTLRAAFRIIIFEHVLFLLAIATIMSRIMSRSIAKYLFYYFFTWLIILNIMFISSNTIMLNFTRIPNDYRQVYNLISNNKNTRYIYFPTKLNWHHHVSIDYSYGNKDAFYSVWYKPFETWFPSRNVYHPTKVFTAKELDKKIYDLYSQNKHDKIIKTLESAGVEYIIYDKYYNWKEEIPEFDTKRFYSRNDLEISHKTDRIMIYHIK